MDCPVLFLADWVQNKLIWAAGDFCLMAALLQLCLWPFITVILRHHHFQSSMLPLGFCSYFNSWKVEWNCQGHKWNHTPCEVSIHCGNQWQHDNCKQQCESATLHCDKQCRFTYIWTEIKVLVLPFSFLLTDCPSISAHKKVNFEPLCLAFNCK